MTKPVVALLGNSIRSWFSAKGFWLVAVAALLPLVMTGAWVGAHRADVQVEDLKYDADALVAGQPANFTMMVKNPGPVAIDSVNVTFVAGTVTLEGLLTPQVTLDQAVANLAPGETRAVAFNWTPLAPNFLFAVGVADRDDKLGEVNEHNNQFDVPIIVRQALPAPDRGPKAPANLTGGENATLVADLAVGDLRPAGASLEPKEQTFTANVTNLGPDAVADATAHLRVVLRSGNVSLPQAESVQNVTLAAGETATVNVTWTAQLGGYYLEAWVEAPATVRDPVGDNNHASAPLTVDPRIPGQITHPTVDEKLTIKEFYLRVLSLLHLRILIPMVALFYAAGTVADARENGSLPYLLTRPVPRWLLPITRFLASFVVAAVALTVGVVLTYLLLFGATPEGGGIGFLVTPILLVLLTLAAYGGVFTLLGVWLERPYLVGVAIILLWENLNLAEIFAPWVRNLTLKQYVANAASGWPFDQGLQWLPVDSLSAGSVRAFWVLLGVTVVSLAAASLLMKRREFAI